VKNSEANRAFRQYRLLNIDKRLKESEKEVKPEAKAGGKEAK